MAAPTATAAAAAFYNDGTTTLNQCSLSGNNAYSIYGSGSLFGGGICNDGLLTLNQSTLSGNSALDGGGGIGIFENGTLTATITNTIVAGNCDPL